MKNDNPIHLNVSELVVSDELSTVVTVLGSCISVFLFSEQASVGGVIHYAMPEAHPGVSRKEGLRYGSIAIPNLVHEMTRRYKIKPTDLKAKIVGGAIQFTGQAEGENIGEMNTAFARKYLKKLKIPIIGESVGGTAGRKVRFHIPSGRTQVATLISQERSKNLELKKKIKVLVVDDSKTMRRLLSQIVQEDPRLELMGQACDAFEAEKMVRERRPDVITLDIQMPGKTGVEWLAELLPRMRIPVIMITSMQYQEGNDVFRALELGAIDYIQKPSLNELPTVSTIIREKILTAATAKVIVPLQLTKNLVRTKRSDTDFQTIIAIGASTGGTEALKNVLCRLPAEIPPILIVQHIPATFSKPFALRLNDLCPFAVKEADDGDEVMRSRVLIAPGGKQMKLKREASGKLVVCITDDPPVNRHKPSVDYLFHSVASVIGARVVGVILTGMGNDGAAGLLHMKNAGAKTLAQDEESCVVYGMPKVANELGGVMKVCSLEQMPTAIMEFASISNKSSLF